jgi:hypothetical protein
MEQNFRALQNENYQLREYILNLQSRLLENQSEFPPAPSHVNLPSASHGGVDSASAVEQQLRREIQHSQTPSQHDGLSQLQAAAAQADARSGEPPYGLGRSRAEETGHDRKPST